MKDQLELAKKLAKLAEQGIGGEKLNAEKLLKKLMLKHGISEGDLSDEHTEIRWFKFEHRFLKLFNQLAARVIGRDKSTWSQTNRRASAMKIRRGIECTNAQYLEFEFMFDFYKKAWDEEVALLHHAFTIKHNLFDQNAEKVDWDDLTEEQKANARRAQRMAESLKKRQLQKQIEG